MSKTLDEEPLIALREKPATWLITGVAGFIGSHLLERLLQEHQTVIGVDSFITGYPHNLAAVKEAVGKELFSHFTFYEGDITDLKTCLQLTPEVDYCLHQAALGSVSRSVDDPQTTHAANVTGFMNILIACHQAQVKQLVYASSSSVYGDDEHLPKSEPNIGEPLSPYALSKRCNEMYATTFARVYGLKTVGLRYFNVFGPRQDPKGAYAAVIPKWIHQLVEGNRCEIYGDGETSRDFCYIENIVQANLLAALTDREEAINQVYNIGCGGRTTLNKLYSYISQGLQHSAPDPIYQDFRVGDVRHSLADTSKAERLLEYKPLVSVAQGIERTLTWFVAKR